MKLDEHYIIALDIGTSSTRAVVYALSGQPVYTARHAYPLLTPAPGWSEQQPDEIVKAVLDCIRQCTAHIGSRKLVCIAFGSQMYSILAVDTAGQPVTNSITWNDRRSRHIAAALESRHDFRTMTEQTGCPIAERYPLYKLLWLNKETTGFAACRFMSIKDYVIGRLTGVYLSDWSTASASGMLDIASRRWSDAVISFLELDAGTNFLELASPRTVITTWDREAARYAGVVAGTPIVIGAGDGPLASIGIGAVRAGTAAINVGTSAAFRVTMDAPTLDPGRRLWTFIGDEDLWVMGQITLGGILIKWLIETFKFSNTRGNGAASKFRLLEELVHKVPAGADGLLFIPGSADPEGDNPTHSFGRFVGKKETHGPAHVARAVYEGLIFSLHQISRIEQSTSNRKLDHVYVTGGLSASRVWLQMAADVFGVKLMAMDGVEGSARGSCILALLAMGIISKREERSIDVSNYDVFTPRRTTHVEYRRLFRSFENHSARFSGEIS